MIGKRLRHHTLAVGLCGLLAACSGAPSSVSEGLAQVEQAAGAVGDLASSIGGSGDSGPPVTGQAAQFVGKYPFEKVKGTAFWDYRPVAQALAQYLSSGARKTALSGPSGPIASAGGYAIADGCQAHNCNRVNLLGFLDGANRVWLCYADLDSGQPARFYGPGLPSGGKTDGQQSCIGLSASEQASRLAAVRG